VALTVLSVVSCVLRKEVESIAEGIRGDAICDGMGVGGLTAQSDCLNRGMCDKEARRNFYGVGAVLFCSPLSAATHWFGP